MLWLAIRNEGQGVPKAKQAVGRDTAAAEPDADPVEMLEGSSQELKTTLIHMLGLPQVKQTAGRNRWAV